MPSNSCQPPNTILFPSTERRTILVPHRLPGNVVKYIAVDFRFSRDGISFKAIPLCDEGVKRMTGLPDRIFFTLKKGKPVVEPRRLEPVAQELVDQLHWQ